MNFITGRIEGAYTSHAISQLVPKIVGNPELAPLVYGLYAGPNYTDLPLEYPPRLPSEVRLDDPRVLPLDIDTERLQNIFSFSSFTFESLSAIPGPGVPPTPDPDWDNLPSALYLLPSFFNHSCASTARSTNFNNIMVIRATQDMDEGEELTLHYSAWTGHTYLSRQAGVVPGFLACDCSLCEADRKDGKEACQRRERLLTRLVRPTASGTHGTIEESRTFLCEIEGTYAKDRGMIRPASFRARHGLAIAYARNITPPHEDISRFRCLELEIASLVALGIVVLDKSVWGPTKRLRATENGVQIPIDTGDSVLCHAAILGVTVMLDIATNFRYFRDHARADRWMRAAMWSKLILLLPISCPLEYSRV